MQGMANKMIEQKQIDEAKGIPIEKLIDEMLLEETTKTGYKRYRCPFHEEKTGSFFVRPETNSFLCFGCNRAGNAISFVMMRHSLSFPDAIGLLQMIKQEPSDD